MKLKEFIYKYWLEVGFGLLITAVSIVRRRFTKRCRRSQAMELGMLSLLRAQIIEYHNHYYIEKKYCPIYAKDNLDDMFKAYRGLDGNGTVPDLVAAVKELPTEPHRKVRKEAE